MTDQRRVKAWETRRAKYGQAGHAGAYRLSAPLASDDLGRLALALVMRLHSEGQLSEGQCAKALNVDRVTFRKLADRIA